jgi:gliding motility-associated-like protein
VAPLDNTQGPGSFFPLGTTTVLLRASDAAGNSTDHSFSITVQDQEAPLITCPADITTPIELGMCGAHVAYVLPTATDNCGTGIPSTPVDVTLAPGSFFPVGITSVSLHAIDAAGNIGTCSFSITVVDDQAPVLSGCADQTVAVEASGPCGTVITYPEITAYDECGGVLTPVRTDGPASGSVFPFGSTPVTHEATQGGLTGTCSFTITVNDSAPPTFTVGSLPLAYLDDGFQATLPDLYPYLENVADCSGVGAHAQSPEPGTPIFGNTMVALHVADQLGNDTLVQLMVTAIDTIPPTAICNGAVDVTAPIGQCGIQVFVPHPQMDDNSGMPLLVDSIGPYGSGSWFPIGSSSITYVVGDPSGLTDSCTTVVNVSAPPMPVLSYPTSQVCSSSALLLPDVHTPASGIFSCAAEGLVIDANTGAIDPGASLPGEYDVDYSFSGPCPVHASFTLEVVAQPLAGANGAVDLCSSFPAVQLFDALGGLPETGGTWSGPGPLADGVFDPASGQPGTYIYTIPAVAPCPSVSATVEVLLSEAPFAGTDTSTALCSNASPLDLFALLPGADPGGTWTVGGETHGDTYDPSMDLAGVFTYTVDGSAPCPADQAEITISEVTAPNAGEPSILNICTNGESMGLFDVLNGSPDPDGNWTDPVGASVDALFDPSSEEAGTYTYTVTGTAPCADASTSITVNLIAPPSADWNVPDPMCSASEPIDLDNLVLGANGGAWAGPGITGAGHLFDPQLLSGQGTSNEYTLNYTVTVNGCTNAQSGSLTVITSPIADAGPDVVVCALEQQMQASIAIGSGAWNMPSNVTVNDVHAPNTMVQVPGPGTYAMQWTTSNAQCSDIDTVLITFHVPEELTAFDAGPDQDQNITRSVTLNGVADGATETHWSMIGGAGNIVSPDEVITEVNSLSIGRDLVMLSARVGVCPFETDTVALVIHDLFIPSGFSPNDDGINDTFEVTGLDVLTDNELTVFNRWGQQVYHMAGYANQWDGRDNNGHALVDGTYFYVLTIVDDAYHGQIIIKR